MKLNLYFFDLSPINIDGKYTGKKDEDKLIASVMVTAKEYQPSAIYMRHQILNKL